MSAYCSQYRQVYQLRILLGGWIGGVIFDMMGSYELDLIISVLEPTNRLLVPD